MEAINRFNKRLGPLANNATGKAPVGVFRVCVEDANIPLTLGVDESYILDTTGATELSLKAATVWGALKGLATFFQLVTRQDENPQVVGLESVYISDYPSYPWRGFMIDGSRHYQPLSVIRKVIDSLEAAKLNTLHWHIVDAEAFPFQPKSYPDLGKGAYSSRAVYTPSDVTSIITYAELRGIRVIIEVDTPGHAHSWGVGYPGVTTKCPPYEHNVDNIPLNPSNPQTAPVLSGLWKEISQMVHTEHVHLGGDEVVQGCWRDDPDVVRWMKEKGFTTTDQVYQYFVDISSKAVEAEGKMPIFWQDTVDNGIKLPVNATVQVWKAMEDIEKIVDLGYKVLLSASGPVQAYFAKQQPNINNKHWGFWMTYEDFAVFDMTAGLPEDKQKAILGGEITLWGESIDGINIMQFLWPRGLVMAERFWGASNQTTVEPLRSRMHKATCSMRQQGFEVGPIDPGHCGGLDLA